MAKILTFGKNGDKIPKESLFKLLWEWLKSLDKFTRFYLIFTVLLIIVTPAIVSSYLIFNPHAATITPTIGDPWSENGPLPTNSPPPLSGGSAGLPSYTVDQEIINYRNLLNNYREQNKLGPVTTVQTLTDAAKWMTNDMSTHNYFDSNGDPYISHTDSLGRNSSQRMNDFGYNYIPRGEIGAAGYTEAQSVFDGWKNSPGHNAIMLGKDYTAVGIYRAYNPNSTYGWYWVVDFGSYLDTPVNYVLPTPTPTPTPTLTPLPPPPPPQNSPCAPIGDVNNDNLVTAIDSNEINRYVTGLVSLTEPQKWRADVNGDGAVTHADILKILRFISNLETTFAACTADTDIDAFKNPDEIYFGTNPWLKCSLTTTVNDEVIDNWPPDFNDDKSVNNSDTLSFIPVNGLNKNDPRFRSRFDLNKDGWITYADILKLIPTFGTSCN